MVVLGVESWRCGLPGYKKRKRRRQKSCLWTGLIHRGEDSTKSGYKKTKHEQKQLAYGHSVKYYDMVLTFFRKLQATYLQDMCLPSEPEKSMVPTDRIEVLLVVFVALVRSELSFGNGEAKLLKHVDTWCRSGV